MIRSDESTCGFSCSLNLLATFNPLCSVRGNVFATTLLIINNQNQYIITEPRKGPSFIFEVLRRSELTIFNKDNPELGDNEISF